MKTVVSLLLCLLLLLTGCGIQGNTAQPSSGIIPEIGKLPEPLQALVEENLFAPSRAGAKEFRNRVLFPYADRVIIADFVDGGTQISLYDNYGKLLTKHFEPETAYTRFCQALPTSDGGLLFVLGFYNQGLPEGGWASDSGVRSKVVKCGSDGGTEWENIFEDLDCYAFLRAYERNGSYYFFGFYDESPLDPYHTTNHVCMLMLDLQGKLLKRSNLGGSDFDNLHRVEALDSGFLLHIFSQSRDGDFFPIEGEDPPICGRYYAAVISDALDTVSIRLEENTDILVNSQPIGVLHGKELYRLDAGLSVPGWPELVLDYGSVYLVVSEHDTKEYEQSPPYLNSRWYYTESVYSLFDQNGRLLYQTRYDSSPDLDAIAASFPSLSAEIRQTPSRAAMES